MHPIKPDGRRRPREFAEVVGLRLPKEALPFVVPDLERDLQLGVYLTMALARLVEDPIIAGMYSTASDYFNRLATLLERARHGDEVALHRARRMARFPEVPELRFGYAAESRHGRGMRAGSLNDMILHWLMEAPGIAELCTEEPDALAFLPRVGLDRLSDAMGTIIKLDLIRFTQEQARLLRFDPSCMRQVPVPHTWDPAADALVCASEWLPVDDNGAAILLAPKAIVRSSPPVRVEHYARKFDIPGGRDAKRQILEDNRRRPSALRTVMKEVLEDPRRFRNRRLFRDE